MKVLQKCYLYTKVQDLNVTSAQSISHKVMAVTLNESQVSLLNLMNDLPVIGYHAMCKELWDRQGANIASLQKEMYGEKLFPRLKEGFWREINTFSP